MSTNPPPAPPMAEELILANAARMIVNEFTSRAEWFKRWNDPQQRKINDECGYPNVITVDDYEKMFRRFGVARRVVKLLASETWKRMPQVYETDDPGDVTPFEQDWNALLHTPGAPVFHYLKRWDEQSGIGRFGCLLLGVDDGRRLELPVSGLNDQGLPSQGAPLQRQLKLQYMRVYSERYAAVNEWDQDAGGDGRPPSPRFGQPKYYTFQTQDVPTGVNPPTGASPAERTLRVHWTRVLHFADNKESNDFLGTPRMEPVYDHLLDARKVYGGSAEMFWKGGFPGYAFKAITDALGGLVNINTDTLKTQIQSYFDGLQRYMALENLDVQSLAPQVADPRNHIEITLEAISMAMDCPVRVFKGSEAGHLASTQDKGSWNDTVTGRALDVADPWVLRAFADRMVLLGICRPPRKGPGAYKTFWPDPNTPSDTDKANIAFKAANAMGLYVSMGAYQLMTPRDFLINVMMYDADLADVIIQRLKQNPDGIKITPPVKPVAPGRGNPDNNAATKKGT